MFRLTGKSMLRRRDVAPREMDRYHAYRIPVTGKFDSLSTAVSMTRQSFLFEKEPVTGERSIARVVVHLPVEGIYDYRVPADLCGKVQPGIRVLVNFSGRRIQATCTDLVDFSKLSDPQEILGLVDSEPLISPALLDLTRWLASRYQCGWWEAIAAALPAAARRGGGGRRILTARLRVSPDQARAMADELLEKRSAQARCLRILAEADGELDVAALCRRANISRSPLKTLTKQDVVALVTREPQRRPIKGLDEPDRGPVTLTTEQEAALAAVIRSLEPGRGGNFLLFGVTGSGKTEIYLRAITEVVARGKQALVLVPEISLTPQTVARFRNRFQRVALLHSGLTDAERYAQWKTIRSGKADVVIGARSAIFAPVPSLGLIVVDEEHETSFKQQNSPRYHARDVALRRGEEEGAPVVLGSATPSLEAFHAVRKGEMKLLTLRSRVGGGRFPAVSLVHMGHQGPRSQGFLSQPLQEAIEDALAAGRQAILFLNRRGFNTAMFCSSCAEPLHCSRCDIALTFHRRSNRAICHYCGHEEFPPEACPGCGTGRMRYIGAGTERVEAEVARSFPEARVVRMDSDTMGAHRSYEDALELFRRGERDILIGTQMIAKGLDFPGVALVGVISADTSLLIPDFRSAERTYQLIAQVSGRAGRTDDLGRVFVQTYNPDHYAVALAVRNKYEEFAEIELSSREELGYPPWGRLLRIVFSAETESDLMSAARLVSEELRRAALPGDATILGPARAPITRISGRFRWHVIVKANDSETIRRAGEVLKDAVRRSNINRSMVRIQIDVDPVAML